jgi:hypothetical protein
MADLFANKDHSIHDFVIIESTMVTSIMNHRWLAGFHHITNEIELYDVKSDPMCHYNLAGSKEHQETISGLKNKLVAWRKKITLRGESIDDDPLLWYEELGDSVAISRYFDEYSREFKKLIDLDEKHPGVTGLDAVEVLKKSGIIDP